MTEAGVDYSIDCRQITTRAFIKMERLLTIWIHDLENRNFPVCLVQIQEKARRLFEAIKENLPNKNEKEIAQTFTASKARIYELEDCCRHSLKQSKDHVLVTNRSGVLLFFPNRTSQLKFCFLVTHQMFGSAELFGRTSTVQFGADDKTFFFCRKQNSFFFSFYTLHFPKWLP